jgi:hypothetical protein
VRGQLAGGDGGVRCWLGEGALAGPVAPKGHRANRKLNTCAAHDKKSRDHGLKLRVLHEKLLNRKISKISERPSQSATAVVRLVGVNRDGEDWDSCGGDGIRGTKAAHVSEDGELRQCTTGQWFNVMGDALTGPTD